jgi:molybdate transport system ATP-binding protein
MLKVDLCKKYDVRNIEINFKLCKGEILVIMGENGTGKSTILNMISGIIEPDDGEIKYCNEIIFSKKQEINKKTNLRKIGYITQENVLFSHLNIYENIVIGLENSQNNFELTKYIDEYNLKDLLMKYPNEISGGQRQRVSIVRSLIRKPDIILMDEAFSAIDEKTKICLRNKTKKLVKENNIPLIFVTHDIKEAKFMSDYILKIN